MDDLSPGLRYTTRRATASFLTCSRWSAAAPLWDPRSVQEEKGDDAHHCQGRYHCTPVYVCIVHCSAFSRSLWLTKAEGQHWCSQAETRSLAATAAVAPHARQTGQGHALGDNPQAAATRAHSRAAMLLTPPAPARFSSPTRGAGASL